MKKKIIIIITTLFVILLVYVSMNLVFNVRVRDDVEALNSFRAFYSGCVQKNNWLGKKYCENLKNHNESLPFDTRVTKHGEFYDILIISKQSNRAYRKLHDKVAPQVGVMYKGDFVQFESFPEYLILSMKIYFLE